MLRYCQFFRPVSVFRTRITITITRIRMSVLTYVQSGVNPATMAKNNDQNQSGVGSESENDQLKAKA